MAPAKAIIEKLGLKPLPVEGGYFCETYKSAEKIKISNSSGTTVSRPISTAIYYLITPESFSALHRLTSDEIFHFYSGDAVEMIQIDSNGQVKRLTLGTDILGGEIPQQVVPKGMWQALRLREGGSWTLLGTTTAPGFEFEDFELGDREKLYNLFPQLKTEIEHFTRG